MKLHLNKALYTAVLASMVAISQASAADLYWANTVSADKVASASNWTRENGDSVGSGFSGWTLESGHAAYNDNVNVGPGSINAIHVDTTDNAQTLDINWSEGFGFSAVYVTGSKGAVIKGDNAEGTNRKIQLNGADGVSTVSSASDLALKAETIVLNAATTNFTVADKKTITLQAGTFTAGTGKAVTVGGGAGTLKVAGGDLTIGSLAVADGAKIDVDASRTLTVTTVTDTSDFVKNGAGTLVISGKGNLENGKLVINGGTVKLNSSADWQTSDTNLKNLGTLKGTTVDVKAGAKLEVIHDALGYEGKQTSAINLSGNAEKGVATLHNLDTDAAGSTFASAMNLNGYASVTGGGWNTYGGSINASNSNNTIATELLVRNNVNITVAENGSLDITGKLVNSAIWGANGNVSKLGAGTLTLSNAENTFDRAFTVEAGTLELKNGASATSGALTVKSGATLAYKGDGTLGSNVTLESGSKIAVNSGALTLNNNFNHTGVAVTLGGNTVKGALSLASGVELTYDGVTYRGTAAGSEISGTQGHEVSVWYDDVTLKNVEIDFSSAKNIESQLDGATINAKNGSTVRFHKNQANVKSVNVEEGGNLNADNFSATITGDNVIAGNAVATNTNGKFVLQGTTTVTGAGNLHSSSDSVVIKASAPAKAAAPAESGDGEGAAPTATLKNVTVSNDGLSAATEGSQGTVTGGYVALKGAAVNNIDFEDVTLNLTDAVTMENVVIGAGTTVGGTGTMTATGNNTVVLTETAVNTDAIVFDSKTLDAGVTLTYLGLGNTTLGDGSTLDLVLTQEFIVALQKEILPEYSQVLTINFDGATLGGATLGTVSASYLTVDMDKSAIDGNSVKLTFKEFDAIPEPATAALSLLALAGLAVRRRRKAIDK